MRNADHIIDAFHLPRLVDTDFDGWQTQTVSVAAGAAELAHTRGAHGPGNAGAARSASDAIDAHNTSAQSITLRWPRLNANGARRIATELRAQHKALQQRSVADMIDVIDTAINHMMQDEASWSTLCAHIATVTGYSREMARHVMDRMARDWRKDKLTHLVEEELGDPRIADGFVKRGSTNVFAEGPTLAAHIFSGNVPGVAVTSIIRSLLVKSPVFGKSASGEPILAAAFARAIAHVDADIGRAIAVTYWQGGAVEIEAAVFDAADVVVHYGGRAAIDDVRRRIPARTRLLDHGPKISFGMIGRDALTRDDAMAQMAADVAYSIAVFDQQGCVSPQVLFVETGGVTTPSAFAERLAEALEAVHVTLPRGPIADADAAAIRAARDTAEFRAIGGADITLHAAPNLGATVIYDATAAFTASCLQRTIHVHPVSDLDEVAAIVAPFGDVLQSVAVATTPARTRTLAPALARAGVTRITTFAKLPWPPPTWHHDGRGPLTELLRFTDAETDVGNG